MDINRLQKKWCGEEVMLDPNEDGLWIIPAFPAEASAVPSGTPSDLPGATLITLSATSGGPTIGKPPGERVVPTGKTAKRITISGAVPAESWSDVFRSFVSPGVRLKPKKLKLGIDFELVFEEGQEVKLDEPSITGMKEAARQLGLDIEIEE